MQQTHVEFLTWNLQKGFVTPLVLGGIGRLSPTPWDAAAVRSDPEVAVVSGGLTQIGGGGKFVCSVTTDE